jgi:hypothetical protein
MTQCEGGTCVLAVYEGSLTIPAVVRFLLSYATLLRSRGSAVFIGRFVFANENVRGPGVLSSHALIRQCAT